MTNSVLDGGNGQGTGAAPQSPASDGGSGSGGSSDADAKLNKILERLERIERGEQSVKDRAVAGVRKDLDALKPALEKIFSMAGVNQEQQAQITRELEWDDMKARVYGSGNAQQPAAPAQGAASGASLEIVKDLGLDIADPQVVELVRESGSDSVTLTRKLAKLAIAKASAPQPTTGSAAVIPGGASASGSTPAQLESQYRKEVMSNRGKPQAIAEIKERFREQGLNVDSVVFGV